METYKIELALVTASILLATPMLADVNLFAKSIHWPCEGDRVTKTHYEFVEMSSDTLVWDFSGVIETGDSHVMRWQNVGDSVLVRSELGSQFTYTTKGDSLIWNSYENPLLELRDSISPIIISSNQLGGQTSVPYVFKGMYCGNNYVLSSGTMTMSTSSPGMLILPNDTIYDVVRVSQRTDGLMGVSSSRQPISSDSTSLGNMLNHVVVIDRWYSPDYRYELVENISDIYYFNNEQIKESYATFLCFPAEQEYSLGDLKPDNTPNRAPKLPSPSNNPSCGSMLAANNSDGITISRDGNTIDIAVDNSVFNIVDTSATSTVSGILCDQMGRVWRDLSKGSTNDGVWHSQIDASGLPQGNYVLYINRGNETTIQKLIIK